MILIPRKADIQAAWCINCLMSVKTSDKLFPTSANFESVEHISIDMRLIPIPIILLILIKEKVCFANRTHTNAKHQHQQSTWYFGGKGEGYQTHYVASSKGQVVFVFPALGCSSVFYDTWVRVLHRSSRCKSQITFVIDIGILHE